MIPQTPLTIRDFDPSDLTLDEMILLGAPASMSAPEMLIAFRKFLIDHTTWTVSEIGAIKASEISELSAKIGEALKLISIPLANAPYSAPTHAETKESLAGSSDSPLPASSTSRRKR